MWEHRLIWTPAAPPWWEETWTAARDALRHRGREPEGRPDTYLVIEDRPDIGLKLRGGEGELEIKVRHDARDGWELWEKIPFYEWSDLEAARFTALLQRDLPTEDVDRSATAVDGVKALLTGGRISWRETRIGKLRMQARAGELVPACVSKGVDPAWLAELVQIKGAGPDARSVCFEAMSPEASVARALPGAGSARNIGYPEFLIGALPR